MCSSFPGLLIGRTAVHSGKDPAFVAYDQFLSTGILQPLSRREVRCGSWLCENSSARRARRNISKKLGIVESNRAARAKFDTLMKNCIFYISPMYEFLHTQGQYETSRQRWHVRSTLSNGHI